MLNKTYLTSDTGPFLDLDISLLRGNFNIRVNEKRDDLSFPIVNVPLFLDGDFPLVPSFGVYISQIVRLHVFVIMLLPSMTVVS